MLTLCCRLSLKSLYLASEVLQKARTCWFATAQVLGRTTYHLRSEWVLCLVPWSDSFVAAFNFNRISITTKIITDRYSVPFACLCWFVHISSLSGAIDQSNSCFSSTLAGQLHLNCHHWIVDPPIIVIEITLRSVLASKDFLARFGCDSSAYPSHIFSDKIWELLILLKSYWLPLQLCRWALLR